MPVSYRQHLASLMLRPGASEADIHKLTEAAGCQLPQDYLDLLRFSDGASGDAGPQFWLELWSTHEAADRNRSTAGFNHAPGALLIGDDGGGTMFGIDTRGGDPDAMRYVQFGLPLIAWDEVEHSEDTLDSFLTYLRTAS